MPYDDVAASQYDDRHPAGSAEAEEAAALLAELAGTGTALELGIGTGRLALPLVARGVAVHGVDSSDAMVDRLRAKPGGPQVPVVSGDFAEVDTLVGRTYDVIYLAFNTIFELESQERQTRCMEGVARCLASGGVFVVEALAPDVTRVEQDVTAIHIGDDGLTLQVNRHDPLGQAVEMNEVVVRDGSIGLRRLPRIRYITVAELDLMARLAGLRLRNRWGGWRRQPFTAQSTRHVSVYVIGQTRVSLGSG